MRYWTFDTDTCRFERASRQAALRSADVAVVNDDSDVQVIRDQQPPRRWPGGEPLTVAGVQFDREEFE
ncbi:MAG: hypothetical protein PHW25_05690 [Zoogloea sp.]|uniref:hypothetical protein n=1 Tax=Zoogloea sp. TaxID=49181 RepID=UPI002603BFB8|nr:hypothetical protein [Zoogloea sp.]MDD3326563.1 hypothetical protein [Zoogloea sp.]